MESFIPVHGRKSVDQKDLEAAQPDFGNKPLVILTHGKSEPDQHLTPSRNAARERAWNEGHNRPAALSGRGSNRVVPDSIHYIQIGQPKPVIDAVLQAVAEMRN